MVLSKCGGGAITYGSDTAPNFARLFTRGCVVPYARAVTWPWSRRACFVWWATRRSRQRRRRCGEHRRLQPLPLPLPRRRPRRRRELRMRGFAVPRPPRGARKHVVRMLPCAGVGCTRTFPNEGARAKHYKKCEGMQKKMESMKGLLAKFLQRPGIVPRGPGGHGRTARPRGAAARAPRAGDRSAGEPRCGWGRGRTCPEARQAGERCARPSFIRSHVHVTGGYSTPIQ